MEFVRHALTNLPTLKGDEAKFMLDMLYDEFMSLTQYTIDGLANSPLMPLRQWDQEEYGAVSREKERMQLYVQMRVAEHFPGMNWREFNRLTPEQTEWVLQLVSKESSSQSKADREALQGITKATAGFKQANM